MATYNSLIDRSSDAAALIPEAVSQEILQAVPTASAVMQLARRLPNMSRKQQRLPVMSAMMDAYFVTGDTGLKQTSEITWENKYIYAEELAVIVPIPEAVLDDSAYDIWGEVRPRIAEAMGKAFDAAVLHGTNAPTNWPDDLVTGATAASNTVTLGTGADIYDDVMGASGTLATVEADGYMANGHLAAPTMRARLRGLRDSNGQPIFMRSMVDRTVYELDGMPVQFAANGAVDATAAHMFSGDWSQLVYAIRQDITYKLLDQAVITDSAGNIVYNLAQQDMVALRAVMRLGWQLPNPVNAVQETAASRYPFAVLLAA
jgi:HK97 family phage major capsid protein